MSHDDNDAHALRREAMRSRTRDALTSGTDAEMAAARDRLLALGRAVLTPETLRTTLGIDGLDRRTAILFSALASQMAVKIVRAAQGMASDVAHREESPPKKVSKKNRTHTSIKKAVQAWQISTAYGDLK